MDIPAFEARLIETAMQSSRRVWVVMGVVGALLLVHVAYYLCTKDNGGVSLWGLLSSQRSRRPKYTTRDQITGYVIALVLLALVPLLWIEPTAKDVRGQQYVQAAGQYTLTAEDAKASLFSNGEVIFETSGRKYRLTLPAGWTEAEFPLGTFPGTVWYGEATQVLLKFESQ